jgi:hypothetical protein
MGFDGLVQHDASELTKGTLPAERLPSEGVDADTLDGVEGSTYARLDQNETVTGDYTFQGQDATIPFTVEDEFDSRNRIELRLNDTDATSNRGFTIRGWGGQDVIRQRGGDNITQIVASNRVEIRDGDTVSVFVKGGNTGLGGETAPSYAVDVNGRGNFSGDLYAGGSVGIGTTSPGAPLTVGSGGAQSVATTGAFIANKDGGRASMLLQNSAGGGSTNETNEIVSRTSNRRNGKIVFGREGDQSTTGTSNSFLSFYTAASNSNTERVRITSSGNVGIGTTSPVNTLGVNGAAVIGSSFAGSNTAPPEGLLVEGKIEISSNGAGIFVNNNGDVVAVDDSGNTSVLT